MSSLGHAFRDWEIATAPKLQPTGQPFTVALWITDGTTASGPITGHLQFLTAGQEQHIINLLQADAATPKES